MKIRQLILMIFVFVVSLSAIETYPPMNVLKYSMAINIYAPMNVVEYPMEISIYAPMDVTVYPMDGDRDGDGVPNSRDAFPNNPSEQYDTDHDGIGNNADKDDDNDGIPDTVERANGLNPLNAADAQGDLDGDGFSNVIEYQMGTNMKSSRSKPVWAPVIMGDIMIFIPAKP